MSIQDKVNFNRGLWANHGPKYFKVTNKGFCGLGIRSFLKERNTNGFHFISDYKVGKRLFKSIDSN